MGVPQDDRLAARDGAIWRDYCAGMTQEALARREGLAQATVSHIIAKVRKSIPQEDLEHERQRSLEMLRELRSSALEVFRMVAAPVFVGKDGEIARDPEHDDAIVRDHGGRLRALQAALDVDRRIASLLGLDADTKLNLTLTSGEREAAELLAQQAAQRVAGGEES